MLFSIKTIVDGADTATTVKATTETGKIDLSGLLRSTAKTLDTGKIRLGGACRLPVKNTR